MKPTPIFHQHGRVRLEAYPNGRTRVAVNVFRLEDGGDAVFVMPDEVNLTRQAERDAFILTLPSELQDDAAVCAAALGGRIPQIRLPKENDKENAPGRAVTFEDPELDPAQVDGKELLDDLATWIRRYVWTKDRTVVDAIITWVALTHFVSSVYFAPLLLVLSATKRCGKTVVLDLLEHIVRRGYQTSSLGATPAVIFRLNEMHQPTFLVDEAEKLSRADSELVELFNKGYRRGARVQRCVDRGGGDYEVIEFDAFGFRALAAIGELWGTVMDRGILAAMERRPRNVTVERFIQRTVETEGRHLARRLARWAADNQDALASAIEVAPRPEWLDDRACDNWSGLFAVAKLAGGEWPQRIEAAARALSRTRDQDASDLGELLLHDIYRIFQGGGEEVIRSGDLARQLNELDSAPWADLRKGQGLSTHKLAALLRPFGVSPQGRHSRTRETTVRGYWREDFKPIWERYSSSEIPGELLECKKSSAGAHNSADGTVRSTSGSNSSELGEKQAAARVSNSLTLPAPPPAECPNPDEDEEEFERRAIQNEPPLA